jgi:acetyltransferase-like isoleucine patch superfamily enzyme
MTIKQLRRHGRTAVHVALALAPSAIKLPIYRRLFGFDIAKDARIGVSVLDVDRLSVGPGARIGHLNVLTRSKRVVLERGALVDYGNIIRGGDEVVLDRWATVFRFNVLNSIPDAELDAPADPRLYLGPGAYVVSGHRLDFTDRITIGANTIVAGRNSSLWTHNRQETNPISIGEYCYLGSEVRLAPGAKLGPYAILGLGAVLAGTADGERVHVGVPARPLRAIRDDERRKLQKKTRRDIPDGAV